MGREHAEPAKRMKKMSVLHRDSTALSLVIAALLAASAETGAGCSKGEADDDPAQGAAGTTVPLPVGAGGSSGTSSGAGAGAGAAGGGAGTGGVAAGAGGIGGMPAAGAGGSAGAAGGMGGSGGSAGGSAGSSGAGAGGSAGTAAPMACSGKPGALRGRSDQTLMADGVARTFVHYAPSTLDKDKPAPIVIVPHGYTMSGQQMFDITQYSALADKEGFVAVFPDGIGAPGPWNVGEGVCGAGAFVTATTDDQAFVTALIDFVEKDQCVDRAHVYMTGFSMGGYFSNETGCQRSEIRAVGPHSGGTHDLGACPQMRKPVIIFHFADDALIEYGCGTDARDKWVARNGCMMAAPEIVQVEGGSCEYYKGCPADGQVALCTFQVPAAGGGESIVGHAWSGGSQSGEGAGFAIPATASATELGWAFFKKYAW
jgi:polyhydroxybutyrate depolymerase